MGKCVAFKWRFSWFRPLWGYGPNFVARILMTFGLKVDSSNVVVNVDWSLSKSNEMLPKTRGHVSVILSFCSGVFRAFGKFRDTWLWFRKKQKVIQSFQQSFGKFAKKKGSSVPYFAFNEFSLCLKAIWGWSYTCFTVFGALR